MSGNWEFIGKKSYSDDCIITEDDSLHTITFKDGHFTAPNSPYTGSQLANVEYHQLQGEYLVSFLDLDVKWEIVGLHGFFWSRGVPGVGEAILSLIGHRQPIDIL